MIDEFIKKVYIKVKELFTQIQNPLYKSFYEDEEKGFEEFKKHFMDDENLKQYVDVQNLSSTNPDYIAREIVYKINRYYNMSGQQS